MLRLVDTALLVRGTEDDPRLGRCVVDDPAAADVILLGCADDTGVSHSGGRVGAALAPTEIRRWFYKQTCGAGGELDGIRIHDAGDVLPGATIEETHAQVEAEVRRLAPHAPVVFLGGGHDLAYASGSGVLGAVSGPAAVVNLDTHLDVRPLRDGSVITSGTPFRRLLERWGGRVARYAVLGAQPQANAAAHVQWIRQHEGRIWWLSELQSEGTRLAAALEQAFRQATSCVGPEGLVLCSLDMDVVAGAFAPGTSAPPADGLDPASVTRWARAAGCDSRVRLLDIVEVSPPLDVGQLTCRLAALVVWNFLAGLRQRSVANETV